jgi:uncharacterized protein (DUF1330 family)
MAAYVVVRIKVHDPSWRTTYGPRVTELVARHGGRYIARGATPERIEGDAPLPDAVTVIEFPSMDAAHAWHNDPDYAPWIKLRQSGSVADIVLIPGC